MCQIYETQPEYPRKGTYKYIRINDMAHTPHLKFILGTRENGLKFTFGSDSRNNNAGRLAYCKAVAQRCNLTADDFYVPGVQ